MIFCSCEFVITRDILFSTCTFIILLFGEGMDSVYYVLCLELLPK